jgi:recombination protein RecT
MAQQVARTTDQPPANMPAPIAEIRVELARMDKGFRAVLPPSISFEKFCRVVLNAIQRNPHLLRCERQSLFNACRQAAEDGLLPDGREGAIIPFREDVEGGGRETKAVWIPMIAGIRKKIRQSGEIADLDVHAVFAGDQFSFALGDEPFIHHVPDQRPSAGRTRLLTHVYSIARFKGGGVSRDVMAVAEIEEIRKRYARSQKGPWGDAIAYSEMAKKTVVRRHAKSLPTNTEIDRVFSRDDALYDLERARQATPDVQAARVQGLQDAFDRFGAEGAEFGQLPPADSERTRAPAAAGPAASDNTAEAAGTRDKTKPATQAAATAKAATPTAPKTTGEYMTYARATMAAAEGMTGAEQLLQWWPSEAQRKLRNTCGITKDQFDMLATEWRARCEELAKEAGRDK